MEGFEISAGRVGFGRGGQVKRGFDDGIDALRQADVIKGLGGRVGDDQAHGVTQADIFTGQDDQAAQDEARVFAGIEHLRQPVQGGIGVGAAHRLDEGRDGVVVGVAIFVIQHCPALDRLLGHLRVIWTVPSVDQAGCFPPPARGH